MVFNKGTLTLDDNIFISQNYTVIDEIINNITKCDKLVINGTTNAFHSDFRETKSFEEFWLKLGKSVVTLELNELPPVSYKKYLPYLTNVQNLSIGPPGIYPEILKIFHENKVSLQELTLNDIFIDSVCTEQNTILGIEEKHFNNTVELGDVLRPFKSTLKCLTINCSIALQKNAVVPVFNELNNLVWKANKVIINCEPIPKKSVNLKIKRVKLNLVTSKGDITKLLVEPLSIREIDVLFDDQCGLSKRCPTFHRVFKSDSVKNLKIKKLNSCLKQNQTLYESFPFIVKLHGVYISNESTWNLISTYLIHLNDLKIYNCLHDRDVSLLQQLPKVTKFFICVTELTKNQFNEYIKAVPNVTELSLDISNGPKSIFKEYDNFVITIIENLENLKYLYFKVASAYLGLSCKNLELIGFKLKKLKELHTNCFEPFSVIERLFNDYQHWEVFNYGYSELERNVKKISETQIMDLPPEMMEKIFLYLKVPERKICRLVHKQWLNIQALSPIINYNLKFHSLYLSQAIDPVKVLAKTTFPYHKISIDDITFSKNENLTLFWEAIGRDIYEICLQMYLKFDLKAAVDSGFKVRHFPKLKKITMEMRLFYRLLHENINEWKLLLKQMDNLSITHFFRCVPNKDVKFSMSNVTHLTIYDCENKITHEFLQQIKFPKLKNLIILHNYDESIDLDVILTTNFNYGQLKNLFLGNYKPWKDSDFDLILKHCTGVVNLGIGFICMESTPYSKFDYNKISKKLFMSATTTALEAVYFVIMRRGGGTHKIYRTFKKMGTEIKESRERSRLFDQIIP